MKQKYIKTNIIFALVTIIIVISLVSYISYRFFASNFSEIEEKQNRKNINAVLNIMNTELTNVEALIDDYAKWDDTYEFINNKNNEYIYENFREGTDTLKELNIDFMIFTDIKNKKIYSKYAQNDKNINPSAFERTLINSLKKTKELTSIYEDKSMIIKYNSNYFFVTKVYISSSDSKAKPNGYLWGGKLISNNILSSMSKIFEHVELKNKQYNQNNLLINTQHLKNIKIFTNIDDKTNMLINTIQLYDHNNNYVFSIVTQTKREIYENGMKTISLYNIVLALFLFIILFLIYKNQQLLQEHNEKLEKEVEIKTKHLRKMITKLKTITETDSLTKINNRRNFFRSGIKALKDSNDLKKPLNVLMMDIDNFKTVNDTYGHDVGDKVLISFAQTVSSVLDKKHIFGRLGGEEFAVIFIDIDNQEAYSESEKIRKSIENLKVINENTEIMFTISSGLASNDKLSTLDELLKKADNYLYSAKKRGKNRVIRDR